MVEWRNGHGHESGYAGGKEDNEMAPKKKKEACCSLFNPLGGLFKDSDDEQLESLSDNEIERIEATPEKINTGKPVKIECRVAGDRPCCRVACFETNVLCCFVPTAEEPEPSVAPRPSDPGPSGSGIRSTPPIVAPAVDVPEEVPAQPASTVATTSKAVVAPKRPNNIVRKSSGPTDRPVTPVQLKRTGSPIVTLLGVKLTEDDVSEGVANLNLESPEAASPEDTPKKKEPTEDHIAVGLNVKDDNSIGLTLVSDSPDAAAKEALHSGSKRSRCVLVARMLAGSQNSETRVCCLAIHNVGA
eukprot:1191147-Prorocentrum_minimum.AAC.1